uniref:Uncharacterized protein n=1 Tax=Monopterus albus TaxID=43700 RepID=A0A3Q3KNQ1_MONAL
MAEDHSLGNGDGAVDVTEGLELLLLAVTQDIFDDVGIRHNALGEQHLAVFRQHPGIFYCNLPLDADTLVLVSLCGDHDISLIQNKHFDLLGLYELEFTAPVQHGTRCANNNLFLQLLLLFKMIASHKKTRHTSK